MNIFKKWKEERRLRDEADAEAEKARTAQRHVRLEEKVIAFRDSAEAVGIKCMTWVNRTRSGDWGEFYAVTPCSHIIEIRITCDGQANITQITHEHTN